MSFNEVFTLSGCFGFRITLIHLGYNPEQPSLQSGTGVRRNSPQPYTPITVTNSITSRCSGVFKSFAVCFVKSFAVCFVKSFAVCFVVG